MSLKSNGILKTLLEAISESSATSTIKIISTIEIVPAIEATASIRPLILAKIIGSIIVERSLHAATAERRLTAARWEQTRHTSTILRCGARFTCDIVVTSIHHAQILNNLNQILHWRIKIQNFVGRFGRCGDEIFDGWTQCCDQRCMVRIHFEIQPIVETNHSIVDRIDFARAEQKQMQRSNHSHLLTRNGSRANFLAKNEEGILERDLQIRTIDRCLGDQCRFRLGGQHFALLFVIAHIWIQSGA